MAKPKAPTHGICPICGANASAAFDPFCSRLCEKKDLLNWMDGRYAVPVQDSSSLEDEENPETSEGSSYITKN